MKSIWKLQGTVSFFHKSLLITLLISSIPMAILTILTYSVGIRQIEKEVSRSQMLQYEQVSERMDAQLAHLKFTVNQWAYNPFFDKLKSRSIESDVRYTLDLYNQLIVMKSSNPLIHQVSLFVNQEKALLIDGDKGLRYVTDPAKLERYRSLLDQKPFIFWTDSMPQLEDEKHALNISLIQKVPITVEPSDGVLIVDLNRDEIHALLQQLNPTGQGTGFLVDAGGSYLASTEDTESKQAEGVLNEMIRKEVLARDDDGKSFLYSSGRETYVVSYGKLKNTGWLYVSAVPLSRLTKPVEWISRLPLAVSMVALLFAVLLSWFASKQLYRPLKHLMQVFSTDGKESAMVEKNEVAYIEGRWKDALHERTHLQLRMEQAIPTLKEGFLLQLVQGHLDSLLEERVHKEMEKYGMLGKGGQYAMLVIQLYGFSNSYHNPSKGDEQLLTFAAANIISEMTKTRQTEIHVINFQDLTIGLLFISPEGQTREQIKSELFDCARMLIRPLRQYLKLQVVIGISRVAASTKHIHSALEDTRQSIGYRDIEMENSIIDSEDIVLRGEHSASYPFMQEKILIQSMQMGLQEEAVEGLGQFMEALQEKSSQEIVFHQCMLQLLGNTLFAMLQIGCSPQRGVDLYGQLLHIREPEAMKRWFRQRIIEPFMDEMQSIKELQTKQIVDRVLTLLNESFMTDISLEACADRFGTYPQKLSANFRQIVGVNFIDYLTALRLEKSKELLVSTDMKINDIAEQVGYQPTYYNRIFKKHENMTPGQYRERHKMTT
ncbi:AraC family transcriptional regulator [Paenibacillus sp. RC67]|uniref:AraC family transcriptional regulator n=1 Tax=Paenibacillus sp. RC67 TaxID=3039392 RepID=UPI0024AD405F|nr:AraC family transcriptional regulator [Paenibacillus sp. RC67]